MFFGLVSLCFFLFIFQITIFSLIITVVIISLSQIVSQNLLDVVVDAGPVHLGDNRSRHSPIMMKLDVGDLRSACPSKVKNKKPRKPAWYKATEAEKNEYTALLDEKLANIEPPASLDCMDATCQHKEHSKERDNYVLDVMVAIMEASHGCIPLSSNAGKKVRESSSQVGMRMWHQPRKMLSSGIQSG